MSGKKPVLDDWFARADVIQQVGRLRTGRICLLVSLICGSLVPAGAWADPVLWDRAAGGNGHLYQLVRVGTPLSWVSARAGAKALGVGWDLASITSAEENAFVRGLFENDPTSIRASYGRCGDPDICWYRIGPWIGGFNVTDTRAFQWVTGEPVSFTDWGVYTYGPQGQEIAYIVRYFANFNFAWSAPGSLYYPIAYIAELPESPALPMLALKQSTVAGCKSLTGTLTLPAPAPTTGVVVTLTDTLSAASTPTTLKILAGATTKNFTVTTTPVLVSEVGTVRAAIGGTNLSQPLTVRPMGLKSVTLSPTVVAGGTPVLGEATLECTAAPGPITVDLSSSNAAVASPVAASIVAPQGVRSVSFDVTTNAVPTKSYATISGVANGTTKSKRLTVNP